MGGEIHRSMLNITIPPCIKTFCKISFKKDRWCCFGPRAKKERCWKEEDYPNAKELCYARCIIE
ncbi:unnamed protein product [Arabidopsis lyrata]|uniref:Embryo surrounding factor 1 brassicaceae domain-containing protein n=1 Tax=Arabidopsis lyrata subsp. lyrata TaxID=81972 RepID=D7L144_ARALL|nr:hypothetical protein ARALYDRAFT_900283 [Arabidopsis lyrata subsp. lyrata]CAH8262374.1 unnamed protein product [Arabidopsis lyrata]